MPISKREVEARYAANARGNFVVDIGDAALLFQHSKAKEDLELVVAAFRRSRIKDIGMKGYFYFTHAICGQEVDALPVVAKMLAQPDFRVVVPQHSMALDQADAVIFCLMRQDESRWVPALIERIETEKDKTALHTLLFCLALAVDEKAEAALRKLGQGLQDDAEAKAHIEMFLSAPTKEQLPKHKPASTRDEVEAFLERCEAKGRVPDDDEGFMRDALYLVKRKDELVKRKDEPRIRTARRRAAGRVSDEGMADIRYLTVLLRCAVTSKE